MVLLRQEIGDVLRTRRRDQHRTLREVSAKARVSLGYLSEIERGQKEASSELLAAICEALDIPLSHFLGQVSVRVAQEERRVAAVPSPALSAVKAHDVARLPASRKVPARFISAA
ncbi:MAG: helix-turn-helix domain-containing protein [Actinomycetota bacterium]